MQEIEVLNLDEKLNQFVHSLPFKDHPFSKRNWGDPLHSLCSFSGKLKPSLAHHLVSSFTNPGESVFDCFSGSGTVPFESSLQSRISFGLDINPIAVTISKGKVGIPDLLECSGILSDLKNELQNSKPSKSDIIRAKAFGFNKTLEDYYHPDTFNEILVARNFFKNYENKNDSFYLILGSMIHILHGNRPYALSRRSHPITPYAPTGNFEYKNLHTKLYEKVQKGLNSIKDSTFIRGEIFEGDILDNWHNDIQNIDAIITSPPFFESTKFYLSNWIRSWFLGWEFEDFEKEKDQFIETKQRKSFDIYDGIFYQSKERLNINGKIILHLGKSDKKDMGSELLPIAKKYFKNACIYSEDVSNVEKHGVTDKGSVSIHQYLLAH